MRHWWHLKRRTLRITHDLEESQDGCGWYCKMSLNTVYASKSVFVLRASSVISGQLQLQLYSSGKRLERDFIDSLYAVVHLNSMLYRSHMKPPCIYNIWLVMVHDICIYIYILLYTYLLFFFCWYLQVYQINAFRFFTSSPIHSFIGTMGGRSPIALPGHYRSCTRVTWQAGHVSESFVDRAEPFQCFQ